MDAGGLGGADGGEGAAVSFLLVLFLRGNRSRFWGAQKWGGVVVVVVLFLFKGLPPNSGFSCLANPKQRHPPSPKHNKKSTPINGEPLFAVQGNQKEPTHAHYFEKHPTDM